MGDPMTDNTIQPQQDLKKSKTRPILFSLLILLSGIIIGSGATVIILRQSVADEKSRLPEEFSRRMVKRLTRELHLTEQQQQQIQPIIEKHMKAMDAIRNEARPKIRQELEDMNDELMAVFDNTQQQIWKERIQRMQKGFPKMRHRDGSGDRRPGKRRPEHERPRPRFHEQTPGQMPPPLPEDQPQPDRLRPPMPPEPNQPLRPNTVIPSEVEESI